MASGGFVVQQRQDGHHVQDGAEEGAEGGDGSKLEAGGNYG